MRAACGSGPCPRLAAMGRSHILLLALLAACGQSTVPDIAQRGSSFERHSYSNAAGTRTYKLYVPAALASKGKAAVAPALVVQLHGCGGDADEEARWSRFNELADARGFLVVYPEQDAAANGSQCWNWFLAEHQARDAGEPSLIAGITRTIIQDSGADAARVYIGGISAGGAMANIMAVTYPDLYAAALIYAGCQYQGGASCLGAQGTLTDEQAGAAAHAAMGAHARVVPIIAVVGELDREAPPANTEQVVQQHLANDDLVDDDADNGSVATAPAQTESGEVSGGHTYSVDTYRDAGGCILAQRWLVHGMAHAWSRGNSDGSARDELFTDPAGPDVTTPSVDFFLSHPMPPAGNVTCHEEQP
jgi:poly(hydroxyalkanoate) depolymerase family esterase